MDHTPRTFDAAFALPEGGTSQDGAWQRHDPNFADSYEHGKSCIAKREGAYQLFGPVPPIESLNAHTFSPVRHGVGSVHRKGNKNYALNPSFEAPETGEVVTNYAPNPSAGAIAPTSVFTNEVYNPSMEAVSATATAVNTNLITNPSAEAVSPGPTELRTNLIPNPSAEVDASWWSANNATLARSTAVYYEGSASFRLITLATGHATMSNTGSSRLAVVAGRAYTIQVSTRSIVSRTFRIDYAWETEDGTRVGSYTNGPSISSSVSQFLDLSTTITCPSGATRLLIVFAFLNSAANEVNYIDRIMVEQTDQVRPYFDGSTPDALGWTYDWTGTPHASISTAKAAAVAVNTNTVANPSAQTVAAGTTVLRTNYAPNPSAEVDATTGLTAYLSGAPTGVVRSRASDSPPAGGGSWAFEFQMTQVGTVASAERVGYFWDVSAAPGDAWSMRALARFVSGQTGQRATLYYDFLNSGNGSLGGGGVTIPVTTTAYAPLELLNKVAPPNTVKLRVYIWIDAGSVAGKGIARFDMIQVEKADTLGPYFDGSTTDALGWTYEWTGTAHASTSTAKAAAVTVAENLATNPAMRAATAPIAVRTNYVTNPGAEATSPLYLEDNSGSTVSRDTATATGWPERGSASYRITATGTNDASARTAATERAAAAPGEVWSGSVRVRLTAAAARNVELYVRPFNSVGSALGQKSSGAISVNNGGEVTLTVDGYVLPALTVTVGLVIILKSPAGNTEYIQVDDLLLEKAPTVGPYFDGSTAAAGDFTYAWTGTANASTSEQRAPGIDPWFGAQFAVNNGYQVSVPWSSSGKAVEFRDTLASGTTYATTGVGSPAVAGEVIRFTCTVESLNVACGLQPAVQFVDSNQATLRVDLLPTPYVSAAPGQIQTLEFTSVGAPEGTAYVRGVVYVRGAGGGSLPPIGVTLRISDALLVQSHYTGSYFDGFTSASGDFSYAWSGAADASTSVQRAPGVDGWLLNNTSATMYYSATQQAAAVRIRQPGAVAAFLSSSATQPGQVSTAYVEARSDAASGTFMPSADFYGAAGWLGSAQGAGYQPVGPAWSSSRSHGPAPAGTTGVAWVSWINGFSTGDTVYLRRALLSVGGANYTGPYFDGDTPASGDFKYAWTGTAHASSSVQQAPALAGFVAGDGNTRLYQAAGPGGSGKVAATQATADSGASGGRIYAGDFLIDPAKTWTGRVLLRTPVARDLAFQFLCFNGTTYIGIAPGGSVVTSVPANTDTEVRITPTGYLPGTTKVRLQVYATAVQASDVGVLPLFTTDKWLLVEGNYTGSYFDGDTPAAGDFTYAWTGTPHASTSEIRAPQVRGWNSSMVGGKAYQSAGGIGGGSSLALLSNGSSVITQVLSEYRAAGAGAETSVSGPAVQAGEPYTLIAWVRRQSAGDVYVNLRYGYDNGGFASEAQGPILAVAADTWTEYRHTFVVPVGSVTRGAVRLSTNLLPSGEVIEWDNVALIKQANYSGPYFDGTTSGYADSVFAWSGAEHLSTSSWTTDYPAILATNLVANPSAEGSSGIVVLNTNLVTNPSAEAVSPGTTVLRTNLVTNPLIGGGLGGWSATRASIANGSDHARLTITDATLASHAQRISNDAPAQRVPITPGTEVTLTAQGRTNTGLPMTVWLRFLRADGSYISPAPDLGADVRPGPNEFVDLTPVTAIAPPEAAFANVWVGLASTEPRAVGQWFDIRRVGLIVGGRTYFDGSTLDERGWDYGWTGTAHSSTSTAKAAAVTVRTNLFTNPRAESTAAWGNYYGPGGSGTPSRVASADLPGAVPGATGHYRMTWSVASTSITGGVMMTPVVIKENTSYSMRMWVRCSKAQTLRAVMEWRTANGVTYLGAATGSAVAVQPNVWTEFTFTATSPATAGQGAFNVFSHTGGSLWAAGDTLDAVGGFVEEAAVLGPYFDGSTTAAGDFTYGWTGTAHASTSVQQAPGVASWSARSVAPVYQSGVSPKSGAKCAAVRMLNVTGAGAQVSEASGLSGAVTGRVAVRGAAGGEQIQVSLFYLSGSPAAEVLLKSSGTVVLTTDWQTVTVTGTLPAGTHTVRLLVSRAETAERLFYIDEAMLVDSAYTGPYFDGFTPDAGDFYYSWTGTADAATSIQWAPDVDGWGSYGGLGGGGSLRYQSTAWKRSGTVSQIVVATVAGTNGTETDRMPVTPGRRYTFRAWVRNLSASNIYVTYTWRKSNTFQVGSTQYPPEFPANTNLDQEISFLTQPAPAEAVFLECAIFISADSVGDTFYVDDALLVEGDYTGPYFDGSYADTEDYHHSWAGDDHNSISRRTARATVLRGNGAVGGFLHRVSNPGETPQLGKVHALYAPLAVDQRFEPVIPGLEPGQEYILKVWLRRSTPDAKWKVQVVAPDGGGSPVAETATQTVSTTGYTEFTLRFTATRLSHMLKIRSDGADARVGTTYLGGILLTDTDYAGSYFDGSTTSDPQFVFAWSGAPYDSPSVRTSSGLAVRSVNKILNPSARASDSETTVRTNLVVDPKPTTVGALAGARATLSAQDGYVRASVTDNAAGSGQQRIELASPAALMPVTAERTYTFSADIRSNTGCPGLVHVNFYDAGKNLISSSAGESVDINDVGFRRAHATAPAPATAAYAGFYVTIDNSGSQADIGNWVDARRFLLELSGASEPYFDGDTPVDGDFTYSWSGAPNASTSVQRAPSATHWAGTRGTVWRSTAAPQLGRYAAAYRVTELGTSPANNYTMVQSSPRAEVVPGETVSAVASAYFPPGSGVDKARILIQFFTASGSATSAVYGEFVDVGSDGMVIIRHTRVVPDDAVTARLVLYPESADGLPPEVGTVWYWGRAALTRGTRTEYFDGNSPDAVWFSTPDESQSAIVADSPPDLWLPSTVTSDFVTWTTPAGDGLRGRRALALESFYETVRDDYVHATVAVPGPGTYTVLAYSKLPSFDSGVEDPVDGYPGLRAISGENTASTAASLVAGQWVEHRTTIAVPAESSEIEIQLYAVPGTVIWWDEVAVVSGDYSGAYFDGSTEEINSWEGEPETSVSVLAATGGYVYDLTNRGTAASAFAVSAWVEGSTSLVLRFGPKNVTVETTADAANFSVFGVTQSVTVPGDQSTPMLVAVSVDGVNATVYAGREDGSLSKAEIAVPETYDELTSVEFGKNTDHAAVENVLVHNTSISEADVARWFTGWASDFIDDDRIVFAHATESLQFSSEAYTAAGFGHRRMTTPESVRAQIFPVDGSFARIATSEPMAWAPGQHVVADGVRYRITSGGGDSYILVRA